MSDITIPGVTSKVESQKMIDALMEAKRVPLDRMEQDVATYEKEKKVWQNFNKELARLRDSAKNLFSFNNPFSQKIALSEDESVLTATVTREAVEGEMKILVKRIATADRFMSKPQSNDFEVQTGLYKFKVGEQEVSFNFRGGSLKQLADAINTKAGKLLKASVVKNTKTTQVFVLEAIKTGSSNKLTFSEKAIEFALAVGLVKKTTSALRDVKLDTNNIANWEKPLKTEDFNIKEGTLSLNPRKELKIPVSPPFSVTENMVLEFEIKTQILAEEDLAGIQQPSGPDIPDVGGIDYKGIEIYSEKSKVITPEPEIPDKPQRVDDMNVLFLGSKGKIIQLPAINDSTDFQKVQIPIDKLTDSIDAIYLRNKNTHRIIDIKNIRLVDPNARGEYTPLEPITSAGDAVIELDGVEAIRETNTVEDLIPEVTLNLLSPSEKEIKLSIEPDIDLIKEAIITFIGNYNQLITQVDILTRNDESIIEQAVYLNEDQVEEAYENMGLFRGNISLMQLKSNLQKIMMDPYPTSGERELNLLARIGISTNAGKNIGGATIDRNLLRGYLQIDEEQLDSALRAHTDWIKELFGNDTDDDLVVDAGIAFSIDRYVTPYFSTGGIVPTKISVLDQKISRKELEIEDYNEYLEKYEQQLKTKYGMMEGMLDTLEKTSESIKNFSANQNRD